MKRTSTNYLKTKRSATKNHKHRAKSGHAQSNSRDLQDGLRTLRFAKPKLCLTGVVQNRELSGFGKLAHGDGERTLFGQFSRSKLHGYTIEYGDDGHVFLEAYYKNGKPDFTKQCKIHFVYGGFLQGIVQNKDVYAPTGRDMLFVLPCGGYAYYGEWADGIMVSSSFVRLEAFRDLDGYGLGPQIDLRTPTTPKFGTAYPESTFESCFAKIAMDPSSVPNPVAKYTFEESTDTVMCKNYLLPDPAETIKVYVDKSKCNPKFNAQEGLFAKTELKKGDVISYYNGIRLSHETVDKRDWALNSNTITLDDETVIDVPAPYHTTQHYTSTLGHKANHSFQNNAIYHPFYHPRFGSIMSIKAIHDIAAGEEIFTTYAYDHKDLPAWYEALQ